MDITVASSTNVCVTCMMQFFFHCSKEQIAGLTTQLEAEKLSGEKNVAIVTACTYEVVCSVCVYVAIVCFTIIRGQQQWRGEQLECGDVRG